ncbi:MAG TPA: ATP-dependent RecD-like DNA helicase [Tissierellaceae bacterium]|nr:ATP-dependent RecD-like DNA helicase [Tissierellaceae bacterium]
MLVIEGIVEEIIFRNENNGYTVARLNTTDGKITVVGNAAIINLEEMIEIEGDWVYHNRYGEQFNFTSIKTTMPSTIKGIENYLSSGLIPYIGPKTAKAIVERFDLDSLDIIQYNPERLKEIPGIGDKKLEKITSAFEEHRELRDIMVYLQQYEITVNLGIKIYRKYGKDTIRVISENPYRLSEDIQGVGFKTADIIAQKMGISDNSPFRIEAGLKYTMMKSAGDGHCYLPKEELISKASKIINVELEELEESIRNLALRNNLYIVNNQDETLVYYMPYHVAENNVARKIVELSRVDFGEVEIDIEKEIRKTEDLDDISFGSKQMIAIKESINNGVIIITGGPGTGKTTTINAIIKIYEALDMKVVLAAPTGRAAKRMTETTGRESQTIHRLLEFAYMDGEDEMAFNRGEDSPIDGDVIIIDEASMIDILLMNSLLKAINPGTRVILVGDVDQLPSVGPGNVLKDLIDSGSIKFVILDEIFRQAEESMIIVNAHRINRGEKPILNEKNNDFFFMSEPSSSKTVDTIIELVKDRLPNYYGVESIKDIQILTPMKKGDVGINSLNKHLQKAINPKDKEKKERKIGDELFRVGDKVMQMKNNYKLKWKIVKDGLEVDNGEGIFNGDSGYITDIDNEDNIVTVLFEDEKEVEYDFSDLDEIKLSYAITVHKSQGSEFPVVVMPIHWGPPMLLTRNLIYTAITRARKLVVLVGDIKYLYMMINNNKIEKRYSSLDRKIRDYLSVFLS